MRLVELVRQNPVIATFSVDEFQDTNIAQTWRPVGRFSQRSRNIFAGAPTTNHLPARGASFGSLQTLLERFEGWREREGFPRLSGQPSRENYRSTPKSLRCCKQVSE